MLRDVSRRLLYIGMLAVAGVAVVRCYPHPTPSGWRPFAAIRGDESASTRLAVWKWTLGYVASNPFGGGFNAYLQNCFRYDLTLVEGSAHDSRIQQKVTTDRARAYHSSYFEMLGEQGWPGLFLWLASISRGWCGWRHCDDAIASLTTRCTVVGNWLGRCNTGI